MAAGRSGTLTYLSDNPAWNPDAGTGAKITIDWSETFDAAANTSTVTFSNARLTLINAFRGAYVTCSLKANGEEVIRSRSYRGDFGAYISTGGVATEMFYTGEGGWPRTITVPHNTDGTKSISVVFARSQESPESQFTRPYINGAAGYWTFSNTAQTDVIELTAIPRASDFSVSGTVIGSVMDFSVYPAAAAFTHRLYYRFGAEAYTLIAGNVGTSHSWTIPESLGGKIPSATSGTWQIKCETYNGAALIGSTEKSVTLTVPNYSLTGSGWYSASYSNAGTAASGIDKPIKGYSKLTYSADKTRVTTRFGAALNTPTVTVNGSAIPSGQTMTALTNTVVFKITDSRGKSLTESVTVTAFDYANPSLTGIVAYRSDGTLTADDAGAYYVVRASVTRSPIGGLNEFTLTCAIKTAGGSYGAETVLLNGTTTVLGGNLSATTSYVVRLKVTDSLGNTAQTEVAISTMEVTLHFKDGGRGAAFGKYSETDGLLDIDWNERVRGSLTVDGEGGNVYLKRTFSVPAGGYVTLAQDSSEHFYIVAGSGWANAARCAYMLVGYASGASRKAVVNLLPSATQVTITANDDATYRISNTSSVSVTCGVIALVGRLPTIS